MATSDILAIVQGYPDIGTDNATYVSGLITSAQALIVRECALPKWPETDAAGYSQGAATPSTDLTSLGGTRLLISIDGSEKEEVVITLSSCTSGANTATEVQRAIRAHMGAGSAGYRQFSAATVAYSTVYTITSPSIGEKSRVVVGANDDYFHVAQAMKLGTIYGGTEYRGVRRDTDLERCAAILTAQAYRAYRTLPEIYSDQPDEAVQRAWITLDPWAKSLMAGKRKWRFE